VKRWLAILLVCLSPLVAEAQTATAPTTQPATARPDHARRATKQDRINRLSARQAQLDLEHAEAKMERARTEFEEVRKLFDQKIVTVDELNKARQAHDEALLAHRQAQINLEKTRLEFLKDATLITVVNAHKFRAENGRTMVTVTLRNDSNLGKARTAMEDTASVTDDDLAALLDIDDVIVTVLGQAPATTVIGAAGAPTDGPRVQEREAIVVDPFQQFVPLLRHGQTVSLTFELLKKDVEAVTVRIEYLGLKRDDPIFLKKETSQDLPTVSSTQYAQQGQLNTKIRYDLALERLSSEEQSYSLVVLNLPPQFTFAFLDPKSDARVTQVKFSDQISKQTLNLEISLPQKLEQDFIDRSINFSVFVTRPEELKTINEIRRPYGEQPVPGEALAKIKGARVELIMIPKGVGKLDLLVSNLFQEVSQSAPLSFRFNVLNSGTLEMRNVTPALDLPLDWEATLEPASEARIDPGQKAAFTANIRPPQGVTVGEYSIKITCEGQSGIETIEAVDKTYSVRVAAMRNVTWTLALVFVLIVLVLIIAIATVRISRR
jgi:hypothetical protein